MNIRFVAALESLTMVKKSLLIKHLIPLWSHVIMNVTFILNLFFFSPDVSFVGYSITHPSENKINLRIQTTGKNVF